MNTHKIHSLAILGLAAALTACSGDKGDSGSTDGTDGTDGTADGADGTADGADGTADGADGTSEDPYVFATDDRDAYQQIDRAGMPAITTALIASKDDYNAASPTDDIAFTFALEIIGSLDALHGALDDDLATFGLTPCTVNGDGSGTCVAQGVDLIIPDTLKHDLSGPAGFPNGRGLGDQAMDITLAVVLLDLSVHPADLFAGLPLNPPANDVAFSADFPYLAEAH